MKNNHTNTNRLKGENSLYLKKHSDDAVHWWSFGPQALQYAKDNNLPIFLSIGYSGCHWCHTMALESFRPEGEIATYLNENFVCIQVDKEEYPDLDEYYQKSCHLYSQSGGWPLSAFVLPDMQPFFTGTYFPPRTQNAKKIGFLELITQLKSAYTDKHDEVLKNAKDATAKIAQDFKVDEVLKFGGHFPPPMAIMEAIKDFQDNENGSYGGAPKFPLYPFYEWAVEQMLDGMIDKTYGDHIIKTIEKILLGGIFDQARGGIHRYSTDATWSVPHFEKMLFDQAGLLRLLAKVSLILPSPIVYDSLINTLDYLECEMFSDDQYFFAAQDADSEGVEGLYYTYTEEEFEDLINMASSDDDAKEESLEHNALKIKEWFQISKTGNFLQNLNTLNLDYSKKAEYLTPENWKLIRKAKRAIVDHRKERIPPMTDNKGVASSNFMLLSALTDVIQYCRIDIIRNSAMQLFEKGLAGMYKNFILKAEDGGNGLSIRQSTTKEYSLPYFENFVFFAEAQIRSYEITGEKTLKENFLDTLLFIQKEFIHQGKITIRPHAMNESEAYPNMQLEIFDTSYKSPVATFIYLLRRATTLFEDEEFPYLQQVLNEETKTKVLRNPLSAGEGLRALTYPDQALRKVRVPKAWLLEAKFSQFLPYFLPRFVLDYIQDENGKSIDQWQICTQKTCELQGIGIDDFIKTLTPEAAATAKSENDDAK